MSAAQGRQGAELALFSAADDVALAAEVERVAAFLRQLPDAPLLDVAYTCARAFRPAPAVLAVVATSTAELAARLAAVAPRLRGHVTRIRDRSGTYYFRARLLGEDGAGRLAFVYPGAASFYPDMLRDLALRFPECRRPFDELEEALAGTGEGRFTPSNFVFPPAPYYRRDADVFSAGGYAEAMVSVWCANRALTDLFAAVGVRPEGAVGFSGGDLNALGVAGYFGEFRRDARLRFLRDAYHVVDEAVNHAGLPRCVQAFLVSPDPAKTDEALAAFGPDKVTLSFAQSPRQRTIAVLPEVYDDVHAALAALGVHSLRLDVDRPFNTAWCEKNLNAFRKFAGRWVDERPSFAVYSCDAAEPVPEKPRKARETAAVQWTRPVRFDDTVRRMHADGFRVFLEAGPRGAMVAPIGENLRGLDYAAVGANALHRGGVEQFLHAVGQLAALGAPVEPTALFARRGAHAVDFSSPLALEVKRDAALRLNPDFPRFALAGGGAAALPPVGTRAKAAARSAARAARDRRQLPIDFGAVNPLISGYEEIACAPGISLQIAKTFKLDDFPFIADGAIGASQLAYSDPKQRGLTLLTLPVGAEIMAELAQTLLPGRPVVAVDDLQSRHALEFVSGRLKLFVRAERVASGDASAAAVKVQIRGDMPDGDWTWAAMEATIVLSSKPVLPVPCEPPDLPQPHSVNWTDADIYPDRLYAGPLLRHIRSADVWSKGGLNYEVAVPPHAGAVRSANFPLWVFNPLLLEAVMHGFQLWRSHAFFEGAFSFAYRLRHLTLHALSLPEGQRLRCYLRYTSVTTSSLTTDVLVSDGNGNLVMELRGYEEFVERVPEAYRRLILQPALAYLTEPLPPDALGAPGVPFAGAMVSDVPFAKFAQNDQIWLRTLSHVALHRLEQRDFGDMGAHAVALNRRVEWLFGRIAAKEAARRFLDENYKARWTDADVQVLAGRSGKPQALGKWQDRLGAKLDLAITHTSRFVVAVVASHARVGVDVESIDRDLSEEFTHGVLGEEEFALAAAAVSPKTAFIRFWCAKEATSKALGTGILYPPRELVVTRFDPDTGALELSLTGKWLEAFAQFRGRTVRVNTTVLRGHVLASCFIPENVFSA